ncbi:MAG: dihydroorotase [Caulobacteraceae bacterium]|nr:dihydroorotase [Caulobacteraceae bacterium]
MSASPARLVVRRPDDWHVHLRDGDMLKAVAGHTARQFGRAIIMPNLPSPVTTAALAVAYRERILAALPADSDFQPLMTAYLTDGTDPKDIVAGHKSGVLTACKLYPAHATTNSEHGVTDLARLYPVLDAMQEAGMPLLVHGEVTDKSIDIFDREAVFIDRVFRHIARDFPGLKTVFEHITTMEAAQFVTEAPANIAATVTPHHLRINRNAMFEGGIRPHFYCLPVAKRETHRLALRKAAVSGSPKFFLGTDSAPHTIGRKEAACGCAGLFNAPYALESYVQTFEEDGALANFEAFASENGPRFYGLPLNEQKVVLERTGDRVPETLAEEVGGLKPYHAGETLGWRFMGAI